MKTKSPIIYYFAFGILLTVALRSAQGQQTNKSGSASLPDAKQLPENQITVETEVARLKNIFAQKATSVQSVKKLLGDPDHVFPGTKEYRQEFFYGKLSSKVDVLVFEMNDGSVMINYGIKQ